MSHGFSDGVNDGIQAKFCLGSAFPWSPFPPTTIYVGLSSTRPDVAGNNITEPVGGGYSRFPLPTNSNYWVNESPGVYVNAVPVTFTIYWPGHPQLSVVYFDAPSGGNFLALDTDVYLPTQQGVLTSSLIFPPGNLKAGWVPWWNRRGTITQYWAQQLAAWYLNGASITWPALWAALCVVMPVPTDDGTTIIEPSGPLNSGDAAGACYSRQFVGTNWQKLCPGRYGNSGTVAWPFPTPLPL